MPTRLQLDDPTRFDRQAVQPDRRDIEIADVDPVPAVLGSDHVETIEREPYLVSPELANAVNLAIALGRPLLLQGDPGAGKTRLAYAVRYALGLPLEEAYIKSTSRAQDLLYTYDAVRRLYDSQLGHDHQNGQRGIDASDYVKLGPLGRAIARAEQGRRSVVLIDEIDKADIDFPNDLLHELDQLDFKIPEVPNQRHAVRPTGPTFAPSSSSPTTRKRRCQRPFFAGASSTTWNSQPIVLTWTRYWTCTTRAIPTCGPPPLTCCCDCVNLTWLRNPGCRSFSTGLATCSGLGPSRASWLTFLTPGRYSSNAATWSERPSDWRRREWWPASVLVGGSASAPQAGFSDRNR